MFPFMSEFPRFFNRKHLEQFMKHVSNNTSEPISPNINFLGLPRRCRPMKQWPCGKAPRNCPGRWPRRRVEWTLRNRWEKTRTSRLGLFLKGTFAVFFFGDTAVFVTKNQSDHFLVTSYFWRPDLHKRFAQVLLPGSKVLAIRRVWTLGFFFLHGSVEVSANLNLNGLFFFWNLSAYYGYNAVFFFGEWWSCVWDPFFLLDLTEPPQRSRPICMGRCGWRSCNWEVSPAGWGSSAAQRRSFSSHRCIKSTDFTCETSIKPKQWWKIGLLKGLSVDCMTKKNIHEL